MKRFLKSRNSFLLVGGVALLLISGAVAVLKPSAPKSQMGKVIRQDLVQKITVSGVIVPNRRTVILAPYNGYIRKMYVKVGDKVRSGDPIATVAPSLLATGDVFPLRAPFPGSVVQVLKADGEYVEERSDNSVIVRIDDTSKMYVNADVPEIDVAKIKIGQDVIVKASSILNRSFKGVIREISLAAREKKEWSRSSDRVEFPIRIEVLNADQDLHSGMSTLVDIIPNKKTNVLTLRHEYIQKRNDKYYVMTPSGEKKEIQVGLQNEEMFEIVSGVSEGESFKQTDFLSMAIEGNL